jgi:hypothetical protein
MGNGGAMRAAPVGAFFADDLAALVEHADRSAAVTHAHAEGRAGAVAVAAAAAGRGSSEPIPMRSRDRTCSGSPAPMRRLARPATAWPLRGSSGWRPRSMRPPRASGPA